MPSYNTPKRGAAFRMYIGLVDQANTKSLKANPTIAAGDFQISKDGGAFANLTTLPSANPAGGRAIMVDLSPSEMTADNVVIQCVDASGAEWCDQMINLQTTAAQLDDLALASSILNAAAIRAALGLAFADLDTQLAALPTAAENADAVFDEVVDGTTTFRESTRLHNSALGGKVSGMATGNPAFRDLADTKNRISAVTDADGNRSTVTRDLS